MNITQPRPLKRALIGTVALTLLLGNLGLSNQARADVKWPKYQDPMIFNFMDEKFDTNFNLLRPEAYSNEKSGHTPWSSSYWPDEEGGIAVRYQTRGDGKIGKNKTAFRAQHYSLSELKAMAASQIALLSPAEKLDIINGDYTYAFTNHVLDGSEKAKSWEGICHGWGPAAADYPEPQNTSITTKDGIVVPVGSGDMKALMAYYYAWKASSGNESDRIPEDDHYTNDNIWFDSNNVFHQRDPNAIPFIYRGLGLRCGAEEGVDSCGHNGMNPAAFHIALANIVGKYQRSYVVNVVGNNQIWNQPVYGYNSIVKESKQLKLNSNERAPYNADGSLSDTPAVKRLLVETEFYYVDEPEARDLKSMYSPLGTPDKSSKTLSSKHLAYYLDLDANDNIIGGAWSTPFFLWSSKDKRSDKIGFAWRASRVPFTGQFAVLNTLYKSSAQFATSYAASRNYTPGLQDIYFEVDASTIPEYIWPTQSTLFPAAPQVSSFISKLFQ